MWNSHSTLPTEMTAQPVGLATVVPSPAGFHPAAKSLHSWRGLTGRGRNSPTLGTLVSIIVRLAQMIPAMTTIQAIVVAMELSRHRRTLASVPM